MLIIKKKNRLALLVALFVMMMAVIVPGVQASQEAPVVIAGEVSNKGDFSLTFNQKIASPTGTEGQFTVTLDGKSVKVTSVEKTNTVGKIKLVLETKAVAGQEFVVDYVKSDDLALQIKSDDGIAVDSFTYSNVDKSEPVAPPTLTADSTDNQVGNAINIKFASNPDWSGKITNIKIDDISIRDKYTVSDANISIGAEVFTTVKDYVIVVKATGYADATLNQSMAAKPADEPEPGMPDVVLNDINGHWAQANIEELVALGAISGYPDGTFAPENKISRAEFASVLVTAFKLEGSQAKLFADTQNHWAKGVIAIAYANGIIGGYSDDQFGPDDTITREQMAVMVVKAAKLTTGTGNTSFTDNASISAWAAQSVAIAFNNQLMNGYPDLSFLPTQGASRAEAVTVILNALPKTK